MDFGLPPSAPCRLLHRRAGFRPREIATPKHVVVVHEHQPPRMSHAPSIRS